MNIARNRFVVKTLLIITFLALTSCSQTKLAYGFLDNWVRWQVNDYVDLNKQQSQLLRIASKDFHDWHRENELVRYSIFIENTITKLNQQKITTEDVDSTLDQANALLATSTKQLQQPVIDIASTLSQSQVEEIIKTLEEKESDNLKEIEESTPEERETKRTKGAIKFFSKYLGKLTDEQKQIITESYKLGKSTQPYTTKRYQQWRKEFKQAMATDLTLEDNKQVLARIIFDYPEHLNDEHKAVTEYNEKISYEMIVRLHTTLTVKQKNKLFSKLRKYQSDFLDLAGIESHDEILKAGI